MNASHRLVLLAAAPLILAFASVLWPLLAPSAWAAWVVVLLCGLLDWRAARAAPRPLVVALLPARMQQGASFEPSYQLRNEAKASLELRLLHEFPADLGGDYEPPPLRLEGGEERLLLAPPREAPRRGLRSVGPLHIRWRSPLGLFWMHQTQRETAPIAVLPQTPGLAASGLFEPTLRSRLGSRPRQPRGEGREFESLGAYTPGDEIRRLDWRATARMRRPIVRRYHAERSQTTLIVVETGRLMGTEIGTRTKLDHALGAALALVHACRSFEDRVGFMAFDRELRAWVTPQEARRSMGSVLAATLPLQPSPLEPSYRLLSNTLARRQRKRALIVLLTDFVEGASADQLELHLAALARRHRLLLVALRDPILGALEEPDPQIRGQAILRRLALQDLASERAQALRRIARLGVQTLDLEPNQVSAPLLDRYLRVRREGI